MVNIDELRFDEKGLIPAVVVDTYSKKVLTVAYMNKESLAISMKEGRTCFGRALVRSFGARAKRAAMCSILFPLRRTATGTH